jgi:hypothetical protein
VRRPAMPKTNFAVASEAKRFPAFGGRDARPFRAAITGYDAKHENAKHSGGRQEKWGLSQG